MEELSRGLEISIAEMEQMTAAHNKIKGILAASDVTVDQLTRMNEVLQVSQSSNYLFLAIGCWLPMIAAYVFSHNSPNSAQAEELALFENESSIPPKIGWYLVDMVDIRTALNFFERLSLPFRLPNKVLIKCSQKIFFRTDYLRVIILWRFFWECLFRFLRSNFV